MKTCCTLHENKKLKWIEQSNGTKHIQSNCKICGQFLGYVKQESVNLETVQEKLKIKELFQYDNQNQLTQ